MDTDVRIAKIEAVLPMLATKADIAETKTAVSEAKSDVIKWLAGLLFAATALILTVMTVVLSRVAPATPQMQTQQPIVIQMPVLPAPPQSKK